MPCHPIGVPGNGAGPKPPDVRIRTLGDFQVLRHGVPVASGAWQSRKARDLLKILVTRRGRPTSRLALMEALWPGGDPARLTNRLSVALSTVRGVLDPGREHGASQLVQADAVVVRLSTADIEIDVESFLTDAAVGLALRHSGPSPHGTELLARAESAYTGDFLEDSPYDDWAMPLREEARVTYLQVLRTLATDAADAGEFEAAARYQLRVLARDPYDERAHLGLVRALDAAGSFGEARRRYRAYADRMVEIDVDPAPFPATRRSDHGTAGVTFEPVTARTRGATMTT